VLYYVETNLILEPTVSFHIPVHLITFHLGAVETVYIWFISKHA